MSLWTSTDAAAATGGRSTADWAAEGISIDTRTLRPGDLFVALKDARDGHDFVAQALEKGAAAALVSRIPEGVAPDAPLLVVPDVVGALEALGRAGRARTRARVLAITGSMGKTSTKDMAAAALADDTTRAARDLRHRVGAEMLDDLVERAGDRRQAGEACDHLVAPRHGLPAFDWLAVAIDRARRQVALRIRERLIKLHREGMSEVV